MPEGDTVWRTAALQHAALAGSVLTGCAFRVPRFATLDLTGQTVHAVVARGKHLFHRVGEFSIHSHLKMEGSWRTFAVGQRWSRPASQARAVLDTERVQSVGFALGLLEVTPTEQEDSVAAYLGPDLLGPDWNPDEAARRLVRDPDIPIGLALLDQRNLAGIGNVYATELCFVRGVLLTRPVGQVPDLPAVVDLAHRMLQANTARWTRSTTGDLRPGHRTWVYGRAGQPCRRCGTTVAHGELVGAAGQERVAAWCPRCQT